MLAMAAFAFSTAARNCVEIVRVGGRKVSGPGLDFVYVEFFHDVSREVFELDGRVVGLCSGPAINWRKGYEATAIRCRGSKESADWARNLPEPRAGPSHTPAVAAAQGPGIVFEDGRQAG